MMNRRKFFLVILVQAALTVLPLGAQSSPAAGLNYLGSDIGLFMLPNYAHYVAYTDYITYFQASTNGVQAAYGTKKLGGNLHFFLSGSGFSLLDQVRETDNGTKIYEEPGILDGAADTGGAFTLTFNSLYVNPALGIFKAGLAVSGVGRDTDLTENGTTDDYTKIINRPYGYITPSLSYGKNFTYADNSMFVFNLGASVAIPGGNGDTTETSTGGIITTTTTSDDPWALNVLPEFAYFFKPRVQPVYAVTSIYAQDIFTTYFYPEERTKVEVTGQSDGYTRQDRSFFANTLWGYINRQYYPTTRFSISWRIFYAVYTGWTTNGVTKTTTGGAETSNETTSDTFDLGIGIAPRIAFYYQVVPSLLTLFGGITLNEIGSYTNFIGYTFSKTEIATGNAYPAGGEAYNNNTATFTAHAFNGINAKFNLGVVWKLTQNFELDSGVGFTMGAAGTGKMAALNSITVSAVYRK
jgi:hypothetical protein